MESGSIINSLSFSYNDTIFAGQNHTLLYPLPPLTITALTVCSVCILADSFIIFVSIFSSLRTSVFMNLLKILAIFDILYLLTVINNQPGLFRQFLIDPSVVHCRINIFLLYVGAVVSSWVTVLISLERFFSIDFQFKVCIYCPKKRICVTVIALTVLSCSCSVPFFYISTVFFSDQGPIYTINDSGNLQLIFITFLVFSYSTAPSLFIVLLNILIMRKLKNPKGLSIEFTAAFKVFH